MTLMISEILWDMDCIMIMFV